MTEQSGGKELPVLARRALLKAAGAGALVAAGAAAGSAPALAAVATKPFTPKIEVGPVTANLIDFSMPPPTSAFGANARLNFLHDGGTNTDKLYVNDSRGKLWAIDRATGEATLFLDLATLRGNALYGDYYQQGLRSFAFHPNFAIPGKGGYRCFYTVSTETAASQPPGVRLFSGDYPVVHHNVVCEWKVDAPTLSTVIPTSRRELFRIAQWRPDHCADQLMFNPKGGKDYGLLYLTVGDGGNNPPHGDPYDQAQNPSSALGKVLRFRPIKPGPGMAYSVPADNPFVGRDGWLPEIYALGFRHPQNLCFDNGGSKLAFVTDIGNRHIEEVNILIKGGNYGWPHREGTYATDRFNRNVLYTLPPDDSSNGYIYPVAQYDHKEGNAKQRSAIAGGFVYRGTAIPQLVGHYVCGDIVTGRIFHAPVSSFVLGQQAQLQELQLQRDGSPVTLLGLVGNPERADLRFGQDRDGEIYVLTKQDGKIRKLGAVAPA